MKEDLRRFLSGEYPEFESVEISEFAPIPGGYSRETYRFDAVFRRGAASESRPCILRKDPPPAAEILSTSRQSEHDLLLRVAEHTNIRCRRATAGQRPRIFGQRAMVMERASGCNQVSRLFNGGPDSDQAEAIATHLCELIAELHLTDPKKLNPNGSHDDPAVSARTRARGTATWTR
jgi:aminoglycoside phosphotransferase (APT) family kinase protein